MANFYQSKFTGTEIDAKLDQVGEIAIATKETLGGIKVGEGLEITEDGVLSALGGTGGENNESVVLWEGNSTNSISTAYSATLELSDSIENFEMLGLYLTSVASGTAYRYFYREVPVDLIIDFINSAETNDDDTISFCWGYGNSADYFDIQKASTVNSLTVSANKINATKIVGAKLSSGSSS